MRNMGNSDQGLIRRVLAGEKEAYGLLVSAHSEAVFRVAFRITENEADADEVVQETFLRGYRALADFDSRANFKTWIYRIAVNRALDVRKSRRKTGAVPISEDFEEEQVTVQLADCGAGPERMLLDREIEARRQKAMERMTESERTAFVLRHMEGNSMEEIAAVLGVAPNTAKQAVFRAVQKLRRSLAPLWVKA
jgi:RNA polymerase sigma-70 factor (ECF subfamily)